MAYDPLFHHRKSIRLKGFDYTHPGAYYITIDAFRLTCIFGEIVDGVMHLNEWGEIATTFWREIPNVYIDVEIDDFIVMPNHLHGIIIIHEPADKLAHPHTGATDVRATQWVAPANPITAVAPANPITTVAPSNLPNPTNVHKSITPHSIGSIIGQFKSAATKQINRVRQTPAAPVWQRNYWEHIIRNDADLSRIRRYIRYNPMRWWIDHRGPPP
jgi:REP element-mobilizing transposase RayT